MSKGKASGAPANLFIAVGVVLLTLLIALLIAFIIGSGRFLPPLPASVGLPDPIVVPSPLPTVALPQPAEPRVLPEVPTAPPPPAQPETLPPPTPIPAPAPIIPPVFPSDVEPVPVEGDADDGDSAPTIAQGADSLGSVEPYSVNGSAASSRSRVACGVRVVHVVRPGENLFRIALRYNTTIASIARRNGIADMRTIHPGQRLTIVTCR